MSAPGTVAAGSIAIEATDPQYFGLKHMPGGRPLGADGRAVWPADQFTFRLIGEGSLREQVTAADAAKSEAPTVDLSSPATSRKAKASAAVDPGDA